MAFRLRFVSIFSRRQQATQIWKDGTGQDYFVYDPNAKLAIHLIYDERQFESEQRREHLNQLESNQQVWLDKKEQLDQIEREVVQNKQFLDFKQQLLNQQIQQYNQEQLSTQQNQSAFENPEYAQQRQQELQRKIELIQHTWV